MSNTRFSKSLETGVTTCNNEQQNGITNDSRPTKKRKQSKRYRIGAQIGVGAHGEVRCGYDFEGREHIAIKIVETQRYDAATQARIEKEIELLHKLVRNRTNSSNNSTNSTNNGCNSVGNESISNSNNSHIIGMREVYDNVPFIGTWCLHCGCTQFLSCKSKNRIEMESNEIYRLDLNEMGCFLELSNDLARYNHNEEILVPFLHATRDRSDMSDKNGANSHKQDFLALHMHQNNNGMNSNKLETESAVSDVKSLGSDSERRQGLETTTTTKIHTNINDMDGINIDSIEFDNHCEMAYYEYFGANGGGNEFDEISTIMRHKDTAIVRINENEEFTNDENDNSLLCHYCTSHNGRDHSIPCEKEVTLIMQDLAYGGELFSMLKVCGKFEEPMARYYFRQIIFALEDLHSRGIYHRDLKPENLVFDANFELKIVDFGLAITKEEANDGLFYSGTGSIPYTAPEIVLSRIHNTQGYHGAPADIWSAAVVLYIMLVGKPPFRRPLDRDIGGGFRRDKYFVKIRDGIFPSELSNSARELLSNIFKTNAFERWNLDNIKYCDWFNEPLPNQNEIDNYMMPRCLKTWNKNGFTFMASLLETERNRIKQFRHQMQNKHKHKIKTQVTPIKTQHNSPDKPNVCESNAIDINDDNNEQEQQKTTSNNSNANNPSCAALLLPSPHVVEATPDFYPEIPPNVSNCSPNNPNESNINENGHNSQHSVENGINDNTNNNNAAAANYEDNTEGLEATNENENEGATNDMIDIDDTVSTVITELVAPSDVMSGNGNDDYVAQSRMERQNLFSTNDSPMMECVESMSSYGGIQISPQIQSVPMISQSQSQSQSNSIADGINSGMNALPRRTSIQILRQNNNNTHNNSNNINNNSSIVNNMNNSSNNGINVAIPAHPPPPPPPPPVTFEVNEASDLEKINGIVGDMDENVAAANNADQQSDDSTNEAEQSANNINNSNNNVYNGNGMNVNDNNNENDNNNNDNNRFGLERNDNSNENSVNNNGILSHSDGDNDEGDGITAPLPEYYARAQQNQLERQEQQQQQQQQQQQPQEQEADEEAGARNRIESERANENRNDNNNGNDRRNSENGSNNSNENSEAKNENNSNNNNNSHNNVNKNEKDEIKVKKKEKMTDKRSKDNNEKNESNSNSNDHNKVIKKSSKRNSIRSRRSNTSNEKKRSHGKSKSHSPNCSYNNYNDRNAQENEVGKKSGVSNSKNKKYSKNKDSERKKTEASHSGHDDNHHHHHHPPPRPNILPVPPVAQAHLHVDDESKDNEYILTAVGTVRKLIQSIKNMCSEQGDLQCTIRQNDRAATIEIMQRSEGRHNNNIMQNSMNGNDGNHLCTIKFRRSSSQQIANALNAIHASATSTTTTSATTTTSSATSPTTAHAAAAAAALNGGYVGNDPMQQTYRVFIKRIAANSDDFQKIVKSIKYHANNMR